MSSYIIDTSADLNWQATGDERIIQNVLNLIRTFRYEVGYDRTRGINPAILDKPAQQQIMLYTAEMYRVVDLYEPRATITKIECTGIDEEGNLDWKVAIEI